VSGFGSREVIITGAGGALGAGLATAFVEAGASVTGLGRALPDERAAVAGVQYHALDVGDDSEVGAFFDGRPTPWAVVNTVGGYAPHQPLPELDLEELTGQLMLNLVTAAVVTKHALRVLKRVNAGRIIQTASRAATAAAGSGFSFPYSVSKLGVLHLARTAAAEVRGTGITVNSVVPSIMDTPGNRAAMPDADYESWPKIPDIARTYLFLASDDAALVNGAEIPV
jgi:NAD(P)-dependent dehydrogenase (short-subunit alcohol dehydrogenase family)